ncbi:MAG: hypothetical protein KAG06_07110, partial [Methylococcales bacterium]|nr:hypothetical protein [Methylococcales bacterium]
MKITNRLIFLSFILIFINACHPPLAKKTTPLSKKTTTQTHPHSKSVHNPQLDSFPSEINYLIAAENKASQHGRKILQTGRQMTLVNQEIIRGGCWDYANAVYNRAGYTKNRQVIFKGTKKKGPYA